MDPGHKVAKQWSVLIVLVADRLDLRHGRSFWEFGAGEEEEGGGDCPTVRCQWRGRACERTMIRFLSLQRPLVFDLIHIGFSFSGLINTLVKFWITSSSHLFHEFARSRLSLADLATPSPMIFISPMLPLPVEPISNGLVLVLHSWFYGRVACIRYRTGCSDINLRGW